MDRVKAAAETARSLKARLDKGSERAGKASRELVSRIALQAHLVGEGIKDVQTSAPIEVVVAVEPAFEKPSEAMPRAPGVRRCWTCTAAGPASAACS